MSALDVISDFPNEVEVRDVLIPVSGSDVLLSARLWLPKTNDSVPIVVEYNPYASRDFAAVVDSMSHYYFAGYGVASIRYGRELSS